MLYANCDFESKSELSVEKKLNCLKRFSLTELISKDRLGLATSRQLAFKGGEKMTRDKAIAILKKNGYILPTEHQIASLILFGKVVKA